MARQNGSRSERAYLLGKLWADRITNTTLVSRKVAVQADKDFRDEGVSDLIKNKQLSRDLVWWNQRSGGILKGSESAQGRKWLLVLMNIGLPATALQQQC